MKKKVTAHLHGRINKLAVAAVKRGDIISCDRIEGTESYVIIRSGYLPTTYTSVGAGSLLYLLNSLAQTKEEE
ncbi:hypothetical protein [Microcoleus sp. bin38.metabat.b11b12b14.051]|uniref:hypothetical protein n=1 Tax=Microcoleus sp. bin38.metabat.b11b12b14.051 TaxID=2742709 RepID=UPI0025F51F72|nr:hypothetical protein [Microcoleus sp. bin38.metabat.b11b12b14.051]